MAQVLNRSNNCSEVIGKRCIIELSKNISHLNIEDIAGIGKKSYSHQPRLDMSIMIITPNRYIIWPGASFQIFLGRGNRPPTKSILLHKKKFVKKKC